MPFVITGGGNGRIRAGRYLRFKGQPTNDLYVSLAHLMGTMIPTFGRYGTGPLPGLA